MVRNVACEGPPSLWDAGLVRAVGGVAVGHADWVGRFMTRVLAMEEGTAGRADVLRQLALTVSELAERSEHAAWAGPIRERALALVGAGVVDEVLWAHVDRVWPGELPPRWSALGTSERARFGIRPRAEPRSTPALPACPACGSTRSTLVFWAERDYRDPFYDYSDEAAEVRCESCGKFSLHLVHSQSRS
jgi:hypothetical protein